MYHNRQAPHSKLVPVPKAVLFFSGKGKHTFLSSWTVSRDTRGSGGNSTLPRLMRSLVACSSSSIQGALQYNISYSTQPSAHMSTADVYSNPATAQELQGYHAAFLACIGIRIQLTRRMLPLTMQWRYEKVHLVYVSKATGLTYCSQKDSGSLDKNLTQRGRSALGSSKVATTMSLSLRAQVLG